MSFPFTPSVMRRGPSTHVNEDNAMPSRPQPRTPTLDAHPLQHTTASVMLAISCDASEKSFTELGFAMGYNNRSSLSHMASGIAPIPLDMADRIARVVGLDEAAFTLAVLHQRHPEAAGRLVTALSPRAADPHLPHDLVRSMRARLMRSDLAFAWEAYRIVRRPLPWRDVERDLRAL
jgi:hypothetical protein